MKENWNNDSSRNAEPVLYFYSSFFKKMAILVLVAGAILGIIMGAIFQTVPLEELMTASFRAEKTFNISLMIGTWAGFAVVSALLATVSCHFKNQETEIELLQDIRRKMDRTE